MKTHFQITFPQEPGASFPVAASNGRTLPIRARSDVRPTNFPTRLLTREEWDDLRRPAGPYQAAYQPKRPVPDVDFEAEDGTLHKTAEACLAHELKARFGVETLDEVEAFVKKPSAQLYDANGNPPFSPVPENTPAPASHDEAVRLLASALSRRGLKPSEAAKATGLTSQQCRAVVAANPDTFRENAGKLFLVS
jgi:hypothetical protein